MLFCLHKTSGGTYKLKSPLHLRNGEISIYFPCFLYHAPPSPQQILWHELRVSSWVWGEENEGRLCLMLARGFYHTGKAIVVQVPIHSPFRISSVMTWWCLIPNPSKIRVAGEWHIHLQPAGAAASKGFSALGWSMTAVNLIEAMLKTTELTIETEICIF